MTIRVATPDHATAIYELMDLSRHLYADFPEDRLTERLSRQTSVIGDDDGVIWGFLYIDREPRPATMPASAPNRLYLRGIAIANKRSPIVDIEQLLSAALMLPALSKADNDLPDQLIFFSRESWPNKPLIASGFEIAERVDNYELPRLVRRWPSLESAYNDFTQDSPVTLQIATSQDVDAIAALDALAFDPHWHFGSDQIATLLSSHRVQIAVENGSQQLVGYTALSDAMQDLSGWRLSRKMHLARIATHPSMQGQGIGKYLLLDTLKYANQHNVDSVMLNTQAHNVRSQSLYKGYGFRRMGQAFTVLTRNVI